MQKTLDMIIKAVTIIFFLFFIVGGIVVLSYCIRIGYFPTGIDVGDSLFFISVALRFTFLYVVFVICISAMSLFLFRFFILIIDKIFLRDETLLKRKVSQIIRFDPVLKPLIIAGGLVTVFFALLFLALGFNNFVISMLASILTISFIIGILLWPPENMEPLINARFRDFQVAEERRRVFAKGIFLISIFFSPMVFSEIYLEVSRLAFLQIGVAKRNADIYLDRKMEPIFDGVGTVSKDYLILKNEEILWTGVGSKSVIQVKIGEKPRKFVVNTNEMSFSYNNP